MSVDSRRSWRWILSALVAIAAPAALPVAAEEPSREALEFFEQKVRPILVSRCQECHSATKEESGLRLDSRVRVFDGGFSGPAVVRGNPDESLLIQAVRRESFEMPPDEPLPDDEIEALVRWVEMGAPWPADESPAAPALGDQEHLSQLAKSHWAFQPITAPIVPPVRDAAWVKTPIDAFILSQLEQAGIEPSQAADRRTLLRRLSLDLTGLPPTAAEIAAFERDTSDDAVAEVVDRLLDSPHYGERWGRHWLDVARYADTRDWVVQIDRRYPYAYTYRDWVIASLNADRPYDEFVRLQIAADYYTDSADDPDLAALGYLTVGPRYNNNTLEQMADRIDVVVRGLNGLTITCARCHDHKFDPIPTSDYYALYGVFASCAEPAEFPRIAADASSVPAELRNDYEQQRAEKVADYDAFREGLRSDATADFHQRFADYLTSYYDMSIAKTESIRSLLSIRQLKETAMTPLADNLDAARRDARWKSDPVLAPLMQLAAVPKDQFASRLAGLLARSTKDASGQSTINTRVAAALRERKPADAREMLAFYGELFSEALDGAAGEAASSNPKSKIQNPKSTADREAIRAVLVADDGPFAFATDAVVAASRLLGPGRQILAKYQNAIQAIEVAHAGAPPRAMTLVDRERPIQPFVFLRGDPSRRGDAVPRRFLTVLGGSQATAFGQGSGRRELAEQIASRDNPLTARVLVDRVWRHHFGEGLVATAGDFGLRTQRPVHAELLDYLASQFMDQGWSLKKLHRTILLSNAYQQSSDIRADAASKDPENRLWWRANRRRLDFEAMRDSMLAASGQLDGTLGGRSVSLADEPFTRRRTVYGFIDRLNLDSMFSTFDFASPDATTAERPETLVPQQALFAMNNAFVVEQARHIAKLAEAAAPVGNAERVAALYDLVFGRRPTADEIELGVAFATSATAGRATRDGDWLYGYGSADPQAAVRDRFRKLNFWTGSAYQAGAKLPHATLGHAQLKAAGGHPGRTLDQAAVRRWIAPRAGDVEISGELLHARPTGDGVQGQILLRRGPASEVLGQWRLHNDKAETRVDKVRVAAGQAIDFVVDCQANGAADAFAWAPTVRYVDARVASYESPEAKTTWNAEADFAAPPPATLGPWEQLAQALLLTNEFMYLD